MNVKTSLMAFVAMSLIALAAPSYAHATDKPADASASQSKKDEQKKDYTEVKVKSGDTLTSIAEEYKTTYVRLYNANKDIQNPDAIDIGDVVRIPKEDEQLPDRFSEYQAAVAAAYRAPVAQTTYATTAPTYTSNPVNSNSYYVGNGLWCTDYVASKRSDIPVYGNAGYNWISSAKAEGKATGTTPKAGAVAVTNGHVAYVESVNGDGSYTVSEMGWNYQAGNYNKRTVNPGAFGGFIY